MRVRELEMTISNLKDQNMVLRAAQSNLPNGETKLPTENINKEVDMYKSAVKDLEEKLALCALKMREYEEKNAKEDNGNYYEKALKEKTEELEKLRKDQDDLLELLTDQDNKITMYKSQLVALGAKVNYYNSLSHVN